jgi:hypothetical protein
MAEHEHARKNYRQGKLGKPEPISSLHRVYSQWKLDTQGCVIAQNSKLDKSIGLSLTPRGKDSLIISSFSCGTALRFEGLGNASRSIFAQEHHHAGESDRAEKR